MAAGTSASLWCLMFVGVFGFVSAGQKTITAESGQNVTLPCRAPNNNIILVVEWRQADLGDEYVLYYRDEQFDPDEQHPSFKNRVDLQDRQMKDGDVSLILKDVTVNDTGTYECRVAYKESNKRPSLKVIGSIYLHVVPPGHTGGQEKDEGKKSRQMNNGSAGLTVCLTVYSLLLLVAVGFAV